MLLDTLRCCYHGEGDGDGGAVERCQHHAIIINNSV